MASPYPFDTMKEHPELPGFFARAGVHPAHAYRVYQYKGAHYDVLKDYAIVERSDGYTALVVNFHFIVRGIPSIKAAIAAAILTGESVV